MSNTTFNRVLAGYEDLLLGDSTAPVTQDRGSTSGTVTATVTPMDSALIPASTVAKNLFGLSGTKDLDDLFSTISTGSFISAATTSARGIVKVDDNGSGNPVAVTTTGAGTRIPSAAIYNALANSAQTPDYGNPYVTRFEMQMALSLSLGSGKDGYGQLGAIAASSTAPTITSTATAGNLTGTYTYKIAAYNLSGAIVASSASASTGAIVSKQVKLTLPALPSGAMGWRVYRSTDGVNWYLVGTAVKGWNYTETANDALRYIYVDDNPYPNTSASAPGSDTTGTSATLSGLFQFITFTLGASQTITVATSGSTAGIFDARVQSTFTPNATGTISAVGANRVNVTALKFYPSTINTTSGNPTALFVGATANQSTYGPTAVSAFPVTTTYPLGIGADLTLSNRLLSGFGTKGNVSSGTGGDGGWGGGLIRIWAYQIAGNSLVGTYNATGQAGSNGSGNAAQGGGGGAGGIIDIGAVMPWRDASTTNAAGGAGGAASGSGGATTITGAPGGGGGLLIRRNCFDTSAATSTVAAGSNGANTTAANGAVSAYVYSGAHYGHGGQATGSTAVTSATAGQTYNLNGFFDPSSVFAA